MFASIAITDIYTLSLHDALPIWQGDRRHVLSGGRIDRGGRHPDGPHDQGHSLLRTGVRRDRKSTRLNSSHVRISYAVYCLKQKKKSLPYPTCRVLCLP